VRQTSAGWGKHAIFEQNASISLARWRRRLLHYFKRVVKLSATCFHVELEQFSACFRVAQVCQRQLGFLVDSIFFALGALFFSPQKLVYIKLPELYADVFVCDFLVGFTSKKYLT